jgi:hypothetical protein
MEQTTDPIATNDRPGAYRVIPCPVYQGIAQALMIPFAMIVRDVLQDRPAEMPLAVAFFGLSFGTGHPRPSCVAVSFAAFPALGTMPFG